ncbi:hypothetical protein [Mycetocola sp. 2940]|uniref:hypothetical protein n=1 Tax=Mycetocola sp. 2940 TaxID=3156452 RepID=UPI0033932150
MTEMRLLTEEEQATVSKAERRASAALSYGLRESVVKGQLTMFASMLDSIHEVPGSSGVLLEARLLEAKAALLRRIVGLPVLIGFFRDSTDALLDPILNPA